MMPFYGEHMTISSGNVPLRMKFKLNSAYTHAVGDSIKIMCGAYSTPTYARA